MRGSSNGCGAPKRDGVGRVRPTGDLPSRVFPTRREFLQVGFAGGLSLALPDLLRLEAIAGQREKGPRALGVIHIFLPGGMAHQESFDPKPWAPIEYRGPLRAIDTSLAGVQFSEVFAQTARIADRLTICRAMNHGEAAHERGAHNMFTGYRPSPAISYPSLGAVISHEHGPKTTLPPYVCVPRKPNDYAGSGYLSTAYGPFSVGADPESGGYRVQDLAVPEDVDPARAVRRRHLLDVVDAHFREMESSDAVASMDAFYSRAWDMVSSKEALDAFDLSKEDEKTKQEYGGNAAGMRLLLARRLIEAGVRFCSVTYGSFDYHDRIQSGMRSQVPALDKAFAALIEDLDRRGLLESTIVMLTTEFGRTPKINRTEGRDHWPGVFSVVLAGGGIRRGLVYGASDSLAAEPDRDAMGPEDLAATVYHLLGIDPTKRLLAPGGRPIDIVRGGRILDALIS